MLKQQSRPTEETRAVTPRVSQSRLRVVNVLRRRGAGLFPDRKDSAGPAFWQLPIAVSFVIGTALAFVIPSNTVTTVPLFLLGLAIAVAATMFAFICARNPRMISYLGLVPALDFIAIAVLRSTTGGSISVFSALAILPMVWFATRLEPRNIVWAFAGVFLVVLLPTLVSGAYLENPSELLRSLFTAAVYAVAATAIHHVSTQARRRYTELKARDSRRAEDLKLGAQAQQALLPGNTTNIDGYSIAGVCLPAKAVGGDFYDWYTTPDGIAVSLGDVMGKGVGAGIIAATTRAVLRSARAEPDPVAALVRADNALSTELSNMESFVTLFHGRLTTVDGTVSYADAGHGLTVVIRADGSHSRLRSYDIPLGVGFRFGQSPQTVSLAPGDTLVSFSDGLLDLYGGTEQALARIPELLATTGPSASNMVDAVIANAAGYNQEDDVTVLAIQRDPDSRL
jgi:sigma-B regulation protein RsbU (phosphoserine phosphatase)